MERIIKKILSPSKQYKVVILKRKNGLYTTEVYMWQEEYGYEFWSPIKQGLSLIQTEENAIKIGIEQLKELSSETSVF
ncbi:hypothetical protein [Bacillus alkalicellulosilyticus]|uniref:hypothetical protein n=1 Tax=Alkalihalobacterium alkalicellulosilyticum TaxID=1912214 RepID=UPI000997D180|nr:hypothetical protein [Bacillus alkalicellulosilyticus]